MTTRPPAVAGSFYPDDAGTLSEVVAALTRRAPPLGVPLPKALILPHAGYRYSGATAAAGMAAVPEGARVARVVVLGPSHHVPLRGVALPTATAFATPLGDVPVDLDACGMLAREPDVTVDDGPHAKEHSIEVELPFLQARLGAFRLVPMVVGAIAPERLAEILALVWGGSETLIAISTDLSHFLDAEPAETRDEATARKVELLEPQFTQPEACGAFALAGFIEAARRRGMRLTRLGLTHSGKVTGDTTRVVGYGAWMAQEPDQAELPGRMREAALRVARLSLASRAAKGRPPEVALDSFDLPLRGIGASFVTLTAGERLRGCIGTLRAHRPMVADISANAVRAGFEDPRFAPVAAADLGGLDLEIALLGPPAPMVFEDEADLIAGLRPGTDGLILEDGGRRSTFLPKVWEAVPEPRDFIAALKVKAGLTRDHWSPDIRVWRYGAERFSGPARV